MYCFPFFRKDTLTKLTSEKVSALCYHSTLPSSSFHRLYSLPLSLSAILSPSLLGE